MGHSCLMNNARSCYLYQELALWITWEEGWDCGWISRGMGLIRLSEQRVIIAQEEFLWVALKCLWRSVSEQEIIVIIRCDSNGNKRQLKESAYTMSLWKYRGCGRRNKVISWVTYGRTRGYKLNCSMLQHTGSKVIMVIGSEVASDKEQCMEHK